MLRLIVPVLVSLALIASGCQVVRPPAPPASAPAPQIAPSAAGPALMSTPASTPTLAPRRPITLTVWLPDALVPPGNVTATAVLTQQIAAFAASQPELEVQVLTKRALGPGDILDLMRTAAPVAPSVLPDVTLLDLADVPWAAQSALLRPLNGLVPDDVLADMFPFAETGRFDERWLAVAYAVDVEHLVYPSVRALSPPVTWTQIVSGSRPYLFPAGSTDALLAQYLAAGGRWMDADGQPMLDAAALTQMLRQLKDAQQAGVISANVLSFDSPEDTWAAYLKAPNQIADVHASRFITQHSVLTGTLTASLPGYGEPARAIARGWAFVVPSRDPARASVAAALVRWLVSAENEGTFTRAANWLPVRRSAFDYWYPPDRYTAFLRRELERAVPPPPAPIAQVIGPAIQKTVADVLRGQAQPEEAAMSAVTSVSRASK